VSMDPDDGIVTDPKTLHKYVYAGGDPVNALDPTGRATIPFPVPAPQPRSAGGGFEYLALITAVAIAEVPVAKAVACSLNTAYDTLALSLGSIPSSGLPAIPTPANCSAKCAPCSPPSGTICSEADWGHPHPKSLGWDPHWHIWQQNQNPQTCACYWDRKHGPCGARQFEPGDMLDCMEYPSWPNN
jgi:hypothetical protein